MHLDRHRIAKVAFAALVVLGFWAVMPGAAQAAQSEVDPAAANQDVEFILSTFSFLVWGVLVMWMGAGFTMLESGTVRTKNASMICLKNVGIYSIAALSYFVLGYNLMFNDVDSVIGKFRLLHGPTDAEAAVFDGATGRVDEIIANGHSSMSIWFFQMLFVATAASIVSGAILERVRLWAFWAFTLVLTAVIYPIVGAWVWGGGWLYEMGFQDYAGSTVVHTTGGCAALAALLVVGPRRGKFRPDGSVKPTPPSNVLVVTLGVLILWLGWFGFNGGSQLMLGTPGDAVVMSSVLANTHLAAASGLVAAVLVARPLFGRLGLASSLNGALAGLVSITAAPNIAESGWAVVIGAVGGVLCSVATLLLERIKLDDVVGAIPVHLVAGIWGTLAASIAGGADLGVQLVGVGSVMAFAFVASIIVWKVIDLTIGMRVSRDVEYVGQDVGELGIESHPEFVLVPEDFDDYERPLNARERRGRRGERTMVPGEGWIDPRQPVPPGLFPPTDPVPPRPGPPPGAVPPRPAAPPGAVPPRPAAPPGAVPPRPGPPPGAVPPRPAAPPGGVPPGQFPPTDPMPPRQAPPTDPVPPQQAPPTDPMPPRQFPPTDPMPPRAAPPPDPVPPRQTPPPGTAPPSQSPPTDPSPPDRRS